MKKKPQNEKYIAIRIRRRPLHVWLSWLLWGLALVVSLEYAVTSLYEHEIQAAVIAGLVFIFLMGGGLVYGQMRRIEIEERDRDL
jgi:4-hydroxybenzoate polyprenyltransferase